MSDEVPEGGGVPRETPPPFVMSPELRAAAEGVFGDRLEVAQRYYDTLASVGVERGLIGPREVPRLWTRHLLNCAHLGELVEENAIVVDVGSGAGLPGIPLALARPDVRVQLVEPLERRYLFLREAIRDLDLADRVAVARGRADEVAGEFTGSVVTARAVAPLATLYGWTLPLCRPGGYLLAIKGRSASDEIASGAGTLQRMGVDETPEVLHCGPDDETGTTVVRVPRGRGPLRATTPPGASAVARKSRRRRSERSTTGRNDA